MAVAGSLRRGERSATPAADVATPLDDAAGSVGAVGGMASGGTSVLLHSFVHSLAGCPIILN